MVLGRLAKPFAALLPARERRSRRATFLRRLQAMLEAVPDRLGRTLAGRTTADLSPAAGCAASASALMPGCGQQVLAPEVNEATVRAADARTMSRW